MYHVVYTRWTRRHAWSNFVVCLDQHNAEEQGREQVRHYRKYFPEIQAAVLSVENILEAPETIRGNKLTPLEVDG
jgi:hypothetical protein